MRLVLIYSVSDGATYGFNIVLPIEAESKESAYVALIDKALEIRKNPESVDSDFEMFGHSFSSIDLTTWDSGKVEADYGIQILTIDEWFSSNR